MKTIEPRIKKSKFEGLKKILFLFLTCFAQCVFAQKSFFGIDAGISIANQRAHVEYASGLASTNFYQNALKPAFGVFYQIGLAEAFAARVGAKYMSLGYQDPNGPIDNLDINYLTIPITIHYSITENLSVGAGPYLSFTLGGTKINNEDITKTYHKNDFGFSFGVEHNFYRNFSVAMNYIVGTKNIWLADHSSGNTIKYTNRALQFTLIYKFKKLN